MLLDVLTSDLGAVSGRAKIRRWDQIDTTIFPEGEGGFIEL
jgi:hypothetical protein